MIYVFFSFFVCAQAGIKIMTQTLVFQWCLWKFQNESMKITTSKTTLSNCHHNLTPNVLVGILPHTYLKAYPRTISDDSMLVFSWTQLQTTRQRHFMYEIILHYHLEIRVWIAPWWNLPFEGMNMFCIARKLERIYKEFRGWRKYSFGNISKEKKTTWKKFESLQNYLAQGNASIELQ